MELVLNERQKQLLQAIIREFMETAEAVGSIHLPEKYELGISPATVRNEMGLLTKRGLIRKSHSSSGRIPTSQGIKYFIKELLDVMEQMSVETETKLREDIFQNRFSSDRLLYEAVHKLNEITNNAGLALYDDHVYYAGISSILDFPEYQHPERLKHILLILEDYHKLSELFGKYNTDDATVLIGEEDIGLDSFDKAAIVFAPLRLHRGSQGYLAVIGPNRMNYSFVIPAVEWMAKTVSESTLGW